MCTCMADSLIDSTGMHGNEGMAVKCQRIVGALQAHMHYLWCMAHGMVLQRLHLELPPGQPNVQLDPYVFLGHKKI